MKLSELKQHLNSTESLIFVEPNGQIIPTHFHVTEIGLNTKHFIDCGGITHTEKWANLQIWVAKDTDHRLEPHRFLQIIALSEGILGNEDLEVEVEYQKDTIGRYGLEKSGDHFALVSKKTDCLAKSTCGIGQPKQKLALKSLTVASKSCCGSESVCC